MPKKPKKKRSSKFRIARKLAKSSIGGPLFRRRKLRPSKPPKARSRRRKKK